jgi:3-dehydroquinate synthase
MRTRVPVALGERSYDILIGAGVLAEAEAALQPLQLGHRGAIITDSTVAPLFAGKLRDQFRAAGCETALCIVPAGEKSKNLDQVAALYNQLLDAGLDRKSFVLALGGGVVGDLAGYVAATFLRGIPFIQVPTTLLAQVDSSVGGKVGVNLPRGKNLVGAFYQPRLVLVDTKTLVTLPLREYRAGLAEVIKYGIIYDAGLFAQLETQADWVLAKDLSVMEKIIARCCEIKAEVVSKDEREDGLRAILNFGHTIGHAIEAVTHYGDYLHGEAIAIGMVCAIRLSERRGHLSAAETKRIAALFERYGFDLKLKSANFDALLGAMKLDKKAREGKIRFVLAKKIGSVFVTDEVTEADVRDLLQ